MSLNRKTSGDGTTIAVIAIIGVLAIAWGVLMLWWLIWSILDLVHGNPVTFWNIAGIVIPGLSILGGILRR